MSEQYVIFKLNNVEYGVDILQVNEIVKLQEVTRMPNTPEYVEGIINLRGKVISIVDLKIKFGLERKEKNEDNRIIVLNVNAKTLGIIVDEVSEVVRIDEEMIDKTADIAVNINDDYIKGVAKLENRLVILLDLSKIF